jgi:hypothetical protein
MAAVKWQCIGCGKIYSINRLNAIIDKKKSNDDPTCKCGSVAFDMIF